MDLGGGGGGVNTDNFGQILENIPRNNVCCRIFQIERKFLTLKIYIDFTYMPFSP